MKAVVFHEYGGVDKLRYEELPTPDAGKGEVRVQVKACGINFSLDLKTRQGTGGWKLQLPHVLGVDIAGEVTALGSGVDAGWQGVKVIVNPFIVCGRCEFCRRGQDNSCVDGQCIGIGRPGGYAEYVTVPANNLVRLPQNLTFDQGASIPLAFTTAWHMLVTRGGVHGEDTVLILGASGGVGVAATQIAKLHNSKVLVVASSREKLERLRSIGADECILFSGDSDLASDVMQLTGGRGVTLVCETVGTPTWAGSLSVLRPEGRLVCCGSAGGGRVEMELRQLYRRNLSLFFSHAGTHEELRRIVDFMGQGKLTPLVDSSYPLAEAGRAQEALLERKHVGKIVLHPWEAGTRTAGGRK